MSPRQTMLYFREVGKVRDVLKARGLPFGDVQRHALHEKALGEKKSSKDFTNADLDKVLAALQAIYAPGDLKAQLRALEQPEKRLGKLQAECWGIVHELPQVKADHDPQFHAENYLNTIARSLCGAKFEKLGEKDCARVLGILRHRLGKTGKPGAREAAYTNRDSGDESVPF